jgi:hypothetical protein
VKAFRPLWVAFRAAVLATAVFAVVLSIVDHAGLKGLMFAGIDFTIYAVFMVIFFIGVLTVKS